MIYYKIINVSNQEVLDVNTDIMIDCVKKQSNGDRLILCKLNDEPLGIVSSDNTKYYHIEGKEEFTLLTGECDTVRIEEIEQEEYDVLKTALDEHKIVVEPEPVIEPEPEPEKTEEEIRAENEYARSLQFVKNSKIEYMSYLCNKIIENGITVELSDGEVYHFSLTKEDQINLMECQAAISMGETQIEYHADDGQCAYYSVEDMTKIIINGIFHKKYQITYFNSLKHYINSMTNMTEVSNVYYGMEIPEEYQSDVLKDKIAQMQELNGADINV